jgi:conjugative relaxase-like TrwC/TraI family protein
MLSVKKILAGRGAINYYLDQTRRGLADYYLPDPEAAADERALTAPGSSWWGGGAHDLQLDGEVDRDRFVAMYSEGRHPVLDESLGRPFRLPEEIAGVRFNALREAQRIDDPDKRLLAEFRAKTQGGSPSVAAWDCTFSPVKSVSLLWAAGDRTVQEQVWAAHTAAVDAGLAYLQEHAAYVRAGRNGVRVLDTNGLVVARMNEWTSRTGDMQMHTHCLILNRAQATGDGRWRALDGRALLAARSGAGALYNRVLEAELTRRLGVAWRDRPDGLREIQGVDDDLIAAFSTRRHAITERVTQMIEAYRDAHGVEPTQAIVSSMAQDATLRTRRSKRDFSAAEALASWEETARQQGRQLDALPGRVVGRAATNGTPPPLADTDVAALLRRMVGVK